MPSVQEANLADTDLPAGTAETQVYLRFWSGPIYCRQWCGDHCIHPQDARLGRSGCITITAKTVDPPATVLILMVRSLDHPLV